MKITTKVILGVFAVLAASSCKSQDDTLLSSNDVDTKYKAALASSAWIWAFLAFIIR